MKHALSIDGIRGRFASILASKVVFAAIVLLSTVTGWASDAVVRISTAVNRIPPAGSPYQVGDLVEVTLRFDENQAPSSNFCGSPAQNLCTAVYLFASGLSVTVDGDSFIADQRYAISISIFPEPPPLPFYNTSISIFEIGFIPESKRVLSTDFHMPYGFAVEPTLEALRNLSMARFARIEGIYYPPFNPLAPSIPSVTMFSSYGDPAFTTSYAVAAVPEASVWSMMLAGSGLAFMFGARRDLRVRTRSKVADAPNI